MRLPLMPLLVFLFPLFGIMAPASLASAATSATVVTAGTQLLSGTNVDGQLGDLILENDEIVIIISALGHVTHHGENGGTIIDAGIQETRIDALGEFYTYFDDDWPRQAVYISLGITADGSDGGPAVIRAEGHDLYDPAITVATEYSLSDGDRFLTLTTWVSGGGPIQPNFELGDAFQWGSCNRYAPGYGFAVSGTTTQAWLAGLAPDVGYAYGGTEGDFWGIHGNGWSDLNLITVTLDPAIPVAYSRFLAITEGDLGAAVSVLYDAMGTPTGNLFCDVRSQDDGSALTGATVMVFDGSDAPHLQTTCNESGQAVTSLPLGNWRVRASLTGFVPEENWVTILEGGVHSLDFFLERVPGGGETVGDTLTVIQRPLVNIPALVRPGETYPVHCVADPAATGWQAELSVGGNTLPLSVELATYNPETEWWTLEVIVPSVPLFGLYDLRVTANGGLDDTARDAVMVLEAIREDYYFAHITDAHLPDHRYSDSGGSPADSSETIDLREVIADINLINPEFVLITGDYINEGELEDYLEWRAYTRAQRMLYEFEVPTFLVAGNHDIGGWIATPPEDGTARRDWWRFFGWPRLEDPPPGAPKYTQNFSFDYGPIHFVGLESYNNYDRWREEIYGTDSFTAGQLDWLAQDLIAAAGSQTQVLFYHKDFQNQLNLSALGVEMALWGHIHRDEGDLQTIPFDLATNNVCEGERSYRLIRVSGGTLQPEPTLAAGRAGENLRVLYSPSNTGLSSTVTADITNGQPLRFENGRLRFVMPANGGNYAATGGSIIQVDQSGLHDVCHVAVDIPASGYHSVTLSSTTSDIPGIGTQPRFHLAQNHPNPFNPGTLISYTLPGSEFVSLTIYSPAGQVVKTLVRQRQLEGRHEIFWTGKDDRGARVASGTYLCKLKAGPLTEFRKMTLIK